MAGSDWSHAARGWRDQELAQFARRAHRRLGRGFVLSDRDDEQPVYVTWMVGAPEALVEAVNRYDPEHEAVVVSMTNSKSEDASVSLTRVTIESSH